MQRRATQSGPEVDAARSAEFVGFANQWTPICFAADLKSALMPFRVAGVDVVAYRSARGVAVIADRCIHRGAALSAGVRTSAGCIQCPFHGWQFDGDGECVRVPWNEAHVRVRGRVPNLPACERDGLIWVYTSFGCQPSVGPFALAQYPDVRSVTEREQVWHANWMRIIENLLDPTHLPFVHSRTVGAPSIESLLRGAAITLRRRSSARAGFHVTWTVDGTPSPYDGLHWVPPNGWEHLVPGNDKFVAQHIWVVPIDGESSRVLMRTLRSSARFSPRRAQLELMDRIVLREDRIVIESQRPRDPIASGAHRLEVSVPTDNATLAFRRWCLTNLYGSAR